MMAHHSRHVNYAAISGPGDVWGPQPSIYDTLTECPVCDARGSRRIRDDDGYERTEVCPCCEGCRYLDADGYPYHEPENDHE